MYFQFQSVLLYTGHILVDFTSGTSGSNPLPFPSLPPPSLPSSRLRFPLEVGSLNPARRSRERYKLPQRRNRIWCILALKSDIYSGTNFNHFPENQLTKLQFFLVWTKVKYRSFADNFTQLYHMFHRKCYQEN